MNKPNVFISYSWTTQQHQAFIIDLAKRLMADGVDVVMDVFDLREGDDKYAFMERMVVDSAVTHVLAFCDEAYASKADTRKAGVGAESQILSPQVYAKLQKTKVIPIVCQFRSDGSPALPTYMAARIWIDFSSAESVNKNWEQLIRLLYDKPLHQKPTLGKPPAFLQDESAVPASPVGGKYAALRQSIVDGRPNASLNRKDFLDSCIDYADQLRVRTRPVIDDLPRMIIEDCSRLVLVRDHIIDWVLLESLVIPSTASPEFSDSLLAFLERLCELKTRPKEVTSWNDAWYDAHTIFVFETFLYTVAALIKTNSYAVLGDVFANRYLAPQLGNKPKLDTFLAFYGHSTILQDHLTPGQRYHSGAAEVIKRQAQRNDITFDQVMQAELLSLMMAFINPDVPWWYPQTLHYMPHSGFPLFIRAAQKRYFKQLSVVSGIETADALRAAVRVGQQKMHVTEWHSFMFQDRSFSTAMNLDNLGTI